MPIHGGRQSRPGLLDAYLVRGVAGPFLIITLAVGTAMMLERALRLIHELAARSADLGYFFPILAWFAPYYVDLALPAAFMVALVLLVARFDDNLEIEAMLASGVSLGRIVLPLVGFGFLIAAAGLATSGWLEPIGQYRTRVLRSEAVEAARLGRLDPGAVYRPNDALVLTFDRRGAGGDAQGIFLWQHLADGRELVLTGRSARIGFAPKRGEFAVETEAGRYVVQRPGQAVPDSLGFDRLDFRESLRPADFLARRGSDPNELTLSELAAALGSGSSELPRPKIEAELYGRIARAALIPLIPLLVLPLAFTVKKGRRGLGIMVALVLLATFHHGMNMVTHLAFAGAVAPVPAILAATALYAIISLLVFASARHLPSRSPIQNLLQTIPKAFARRRWGAGQSPGGSGRTLAAYLGWRLAGWTFAALLGIVLLLQMVDLLERGGEFVDHGLGFAGVARHFLLQLPLMLQQAIPIAALAGAMTVFAGLARAREMTAIRGAGVSQWRILVMALPLPLILSAATFLLSEYAVPRTQVSLAAWWAETRPEAEIPASAERWFRIGDEIVRAGSAEPDGSGIGGIDIFRRDRSGLLAERVTAARAESADGQWMLEQVVLTRFGEGEAIVERSRRMAWDSPLQPDDVAAFFSSARSLSSSAARRAAGEAAPVSQSQALFATRILRSAAEPLAPLIMILLALPLAFVVPRTGASWPALLYAAGGGLAYLVADGILTVFAQVGYVPPLVGAWAAPAVALPTALTVLLFAER